MTQLKGYPNFDLMTFCMGGDPLRKKTTPGRYVAEDGKRFRIGRGLQTMLVFMAQGLLRQKGCGIKCRGCSTKTLYSTSTKILYFCTIFGLRKHVSFLWSRGSCDNKSCGKEGRVCCPKTFYLSCARVPYFDTNFLKAIWYCI